MLCISLSGCSKEDAAKELLESADNAYSAKKFDDAKQKYIKLSEKYKDTTAGKKAEEILIDYDKKVEYLTGKRDADVAAKSTNKAAKKTADYDELTNAFNVVFSRNKFKELYSGIKYESGLNTLRIYVNDNWFYIPKGVKENFVDSSAKVWFGMQGARGINPDTSISIYIHNEGSNRKLASWGDIRGVVINE